MSIITYDETNKLYKIKNPEKLNIDKDIILEADISIKKNNELRKIADMTTLGNYDMNLLYKYSILKFHNSQLYDQFINEPLKTLFPHVSSNNLCINKLMVISHNYVINKQTDIEPFEIEYDTQLIFYMKYAFIVIILFFINICLFCYLYKLQM